MDLVVTCPKTFWREWIAEGDPAGVSWSGKEWGWYMGRRRPPISAGDRLYVVAWGRLRGYAPVTAVRGLSFSAAHGAHGPVGVWVDVDKLRQSEIGTIEQWCICRRGDAVAVTIPRALPGFQGWRHRSWDREQESPFPDWQTAGIAA